MRPGKRNPLLERRFILKEEDFKPEANRKFFRLTIGKEVRLKSAYIIKANEVVYDEQEYIRRGLCAL